MMYLEITFTDSEELGVTSRILQIETKLSKEQIINFYRSYCKKEGLHIFGICSHTEEEIKRWNKREKLSIDTYKDVNSNTVKSVDYTHKATEYAEKYGIVTYKVVGKYMIFYQNYANKEYVNGKWIDKACTFKRTIDLDILKVESVQLKRVQKQGWDNV